MDGNAFILISSNFNFKNREHNETNATREMTL